MGQRDTVFLSDLLKLLYESCQPFFMIRRYRIGNNISSENRARLLEARKHVGMQRLYTVFRKAGIRIDRVFERLPLDRQLARLNSRSLVKFLEPLRHLVEGRKGLWIAATEGCREVSAPRAEMGI